MTPPKTYAPLDGRSVRPADLEPVRREAVTGSDRPPRRRGGRHTNWREVPVLIAVALLLAFVIKTLLVQAFFIPSGSMIPTLEVGDRVLVEKVTYRLREPQRGEIVVFRRPGLEDEGFSITRTARSFLEGLGLAQPDPDRDLIKRIIGLPGERVALIDGVVYVNGIPLDEPYARPETRDFAQITVPADHYFVLGDNRSNSLDSRFTLGTVPRGNIVGRAFVILWPPGNFTFELDRDYDAAGEVPNTGLGDAPTPSPDAQDPPATDPTHTPPPEAVPPADATPVPTPPASPGVIDPIF